jgi:DNA-binding MarR family transcriptional regulator/N-acetylglutamate synthase-like GNAT family acetyltransferase
MIASMAPDMIAERVAAVRAFNRFYTRRIGVVTEGMHETPHSLPEARVLYELGLRPVTEVADLRRELGIDAGHLSRLLTRMDDKGLITRERSESDGRRQRVRMTEAGAAARAVLDERSAVENHRLLDGLDDGEQRRLLEALGTVRELLGDAPAVPTIVLRAAEVGDIGWMVERHGTLYAQEFGWWDPRFEALCARIVADFADGHDSAREATWIAEVNGRRAGCIMCVDRGDGVAQLRLLLVEPSARGLGLGTRLVDECVRFAVRAGYREMRLWTNSVLQAARRVYERAGFTLVEETEEVDGFAPDRIFQTWARTL